MQTGAGLDIPFEEQRNEPSTRMCGAAALCMVYRSLGISCTQSEVWERISRRGYRGQSTARTHLLCKDAVERGLAGAIVQVGEPWRALECCTTASVRVILNHRITADQPSGHFSVLVGVENDHVVLHDPKFGPSQRLKRDDFLALWKPRGFSPEIIGNILVAIAAPGPEVAACAVCGQEIPPSFRCLGCQETFPLRPVAALGCVEVGCSGCLWKKLFCPHCDRDVLSLTGPSAGTSSLGMFDLSSLFPRKVEKAGDSTPKEPSKPSLEESPSPASDTDVELNSTVTNHEKPK